MFSSADYVSLVSDKFSIRVNAYLDSLKKAVKPGMVVCEIGAGFGLFSLYALKLGASKAYAIEPHDVLSFSKELISQNNFGDKLVLLKDFSNKLELPEKVDLLVGDIHGAIPFYESSPNSMYDARDRFLKSGGTAMPGKDFGYAALVSNSDFYKRYSITNIIAKTGLSFDGLKDFSLNSPRKVNFNSKHLVSQEEPIFEIDYYTSKQDSLKINIDWKFPENQKKLHGFLVWFDSEVSKEIIIKNGPSFAETIYGQLYFPFLEEVELEEQSKLSTELKAERTGQDYLWSWNTYIKDRNGERKLLFKQCSLLQNPLLSDVPKIKIANS